MNVYKKQMVQLHNLKLYNAYNWISKKLNMLYYLKLTSRFTSLSHMLLTSYASHTCFNILMLLKLPQVRFSKSI